MSYTVYKHTSPSSKVYIGVTCQKPEHRWNSGYGYARQPRFYRAIQKYGWENFNHEIIAKDLTEEEACRMEIELIANYQSNMPEFGYNLSSGGESGYLGCVQSIEARRKISQRLTGIVRSTETRIKMSKAKSGENHPSYGKHFSQDHREKLSQALRNCSTTSKRVAQYTVDGEFVNEYPSTREASRILQINQSSIANCCRGKYKTSCGFKWKYIN